ncbi:MAG: alpha-E domain-containing protein [Verrucomicrobiota bacterium]
MLSRVANNLYWLARYIERAENLSRLIKTHEEALTDLVWSGEEDTSSSWRSLLEVTALEEVYDEIQEDLDHPCEIPEFLSVLPAHTNSIFSCFSHARENARAVRDQISEEMWLNLNAAYIDLRDQGRSLWKESPASFCDLVIRQCLLFHGVTDATISHGDPWSFIQLGRYLERADKTSRFLDIPHFIPEPNRNVIWPTVVRACGALSNYRQRYPGDVTAHHSTSLLVFSSTFPRSVRFCLRQVNQVLRRVSNSPAHYTYSNEAERLAGSLLSRLDFAGENEIAKLGLHGYLDTVQIGLNAIGMELANAYFQIDAPEPSNFNPMPRTNSQFQTQSFS